MNLAKSVGIPENPADNKREVSLRVDAARVARCFPPPPLASPNTREFYRGNSQPWNTDARNLYPPDISFRSALSSRVPFTLYYSLTTQRYRSPNQYVSRRDNHLFNLLAIGVNLRLRAPIFVVFTQGYPGAKILNIRALSDRVCSLYSCPLDILFTEFVVAKCINC